MASNPPVTPNSDSKDTGKPSSEDEVLMREIDEAVRSDELGDFMNRYGKPLLGVLVAGLLGFGGYLFWDSRQEAAMEQSSEDLVAAIDQVKAGNLDSADKAAAALADSDNVGAASAASMLRAGIAMEQDKAKEAAALFAQVADDAKAPPALRDLAKVREMTATFDERKPAEVIAALKDLAVPGNPYFGSAGELTAMAHLEAGDEAKAGAMFADIAKSEDVPESLRQRARQMAGMLGVDAIEDVDKLLEEQGIATASAAKEAEEAAAADAAAE